MTDDQLHAYVPQLLLHRDAAGPRHWETEGTLVFADVSGFTRLTEKLSRHGKAGAEEIVRTISDVFTVLLTATADGGDVLKFSGDALVLFYDSPDHAQRACHAASTMQRVLGAIGGIDSSRGRVRLRMSVGIHTGRFTFFLCGGDHLELYVLGGAATTTVATESAARVGEVLVSQTTAAALHDATYGAPRGDAVVLRSVPPLAPTAASLPPAEPPDASVGALARRFVPPPLRDRLADDDLEHEHRRATVSFAHFGGVDDLMAREGVAAAFERVQALTAAAMQALADHGVLLTATDVARGGGVLMLTAGAPDATGDDEARMLRVARALVDTACGLPVRIGVNAGDLFVGIVGAPFRRTYSTMGAATNLAARIMGVAPWDGVLASAAVLGEVRGRFATTPVPTFTVKGRAQPVEASLVGAAVSAVTASADRSVPFVGRVDELDQLHAALADALAGRGSVVELVGDHGFGKSRLVAELRSQATADIAWITATCDPYERTSPYHTANGILRRILGIPVSATPAAAGAALSDVVESAAPDLGAWLPLIAHVARAEVPQTPQTVEVAPRYRLVRSHQAIGDLLAAVAVGSGVVVLEDAQYMDDASAELIAAVLARMLPAQPWLVIVTRAREAVGLHTGRGYDATVLDIGPLGPEVATDLAARLAEHTPVPSHLLPQLVERAAGNPLFLAALVDAQGTGSGELPRSVETVIAARIDRLEPGDRRALRFLSVLGDRFDAHLLDASLSTLGVDSGQSDRWERLAEFVTRDDQRFAFRNALVREVAYEGLTFRRRRQLHALVADAIGTSRHAAESQLAIHLLRAERWGEAWTVARDDAARARDGGANAVAGELYEMALRAARGLDLPPADIADTALAAGEVWEHAGLWDRALDAYAVAAGVLQDGPDRLHVALRRARALEGAGRYTEALRSYRRVLSNANVTTAGTARDCCVARAHAGYASVRLGQSRPTDAIHHAHDAVEQARRAGDEETLAHAYHLLDRAHAALGDHVTAAGFRDLALPVFAALGDLAAQGTVLHDLGADAQRAGRFEEALWLYERSHEVRSRAGDVVRTAASSNAMGEVLLELGRAADAHERFTEALRAWRGARSPRGVAEATHNLGVAALHDRDVAEAVRLLHEAAELAERIGAEALSDEIRLPLAEALLASGRYVEAWDAAGRAVHSVDSAAAGRAHRIRAEALMRTGGTARACTELTTAIALADAAGDTTGCTAARLLLGQIDDVTRGEGGSKHAGDDGPPSQRSPRSPRREQRQRVASGRA